MLTGPTLTDNEEGAIAYVEYFIALSDYAATTGDMELWNSYSHESCQFCAGLRDGIGAIIEAGYVQRVEATQIIAVHSAEEIDSSGVYEVVVDLRLGRSFDVGPEGKVVNEVGSSEVRSTFLVERLDDGSWITYEAGETSES